MISLILNVKLPLLNLNCKLIKKIYIKIIYIYIN